MTMRPQERPGVVTLVAMVLNISATLALVTSAVYFFRRDHADFAAQTGLDSSEMLFISIMELIIAALLFLVAAGVMSGQKGARLFVGLIVGLRLATSMYTLVSYGLGDGVLIYVVVGLFVLWALYGHAESERFFSRRPAAA